MILVSACLLGCRTRYDGGDNLHKLLKEYEKKGRFVAVCPECLGGLPTPRPPSEIKGGDGRNVLRGDAGIADNKGGEVTAKFLLGAEKALAFAAENHVHYAILKERSPSCGVKQIYDGCFSGQKIVGMGVLTALLRREGLAVFSEEEMTRPLLDKLLSGERRNTK